MVRMKHKKCEKEKVERKEAKLLHKLCKIKAEAAGKRKDSSCKKEKKRRGAAKQALKKCEKQRCCE